MKTSFIAFFALLALVGCQRNEQLTLKSTQDQLLSHPGKELMETYCYACHKPQGEGQGRLAPPMVMVKQHYMTDDISETEFIANIADWVEDPNWDHLKMNGAARRFGMMPKHGFPREKVELIAEYLYRIDFDEAEDCGNHGKGHQKGRKAQNKS